VPAVVLGDELRLRELFLNLLDNAVKYSRPGGTVDIALTIEQTRARVSVIDHGIGIALEDQSRIFDRFYRTDNARAHTKKGTGLGLSICAWIVESHRGRIEVQSKIGEGSTFTVLLPLAPSHQLNTSNNKKIKKSFSVTGRGARSVTNRHE
jgi:signal transduction histidine kinase